MTATTALVFWLRGDATLQGLVAGRIYQGQAPQSTAYPYVVLSRVSEPLDYHLRGEVLQRRTLVQIDHYARPESGVDAKTLVDDVAAAVDARLSGRTFVQGDVAFTECRREAARDDVASPSQQPDAPYHVLLEYFVWSQTLKGA